LEHKVKTDQNFRTQKNFDRERLALKILSGNGDNTNRSAIKLVWWIGR